MRKRKKLESDSGLIHCPMIGCSYSVSIESLRAYWAHRNGLHAGARSLILDKSR
jgi:hypothetical protein